MLCLHLSPHTRHCHPQCHPAPLTDPTSNNTLHPDQTFTVFRLSYSHSVLLYSQDLQSCREQIFTFYNNFFLSPIQTLENILSYFSACLAQEGLVHSTIRTYLFGVHQIQITRDLPDSH